MMDAMGEGFGYGNDMDDTELRAGGNFGASPVNQGDPMEDLRRRHEGTRIIVDDRVMLVLAFGTKYDKKEYAHKYKLEGRHDIPIGYKCIIKWEQDEVVFMTRQGAAGPEYQIVYIPQEPDPDEFTIFQWNPEMPAVWDQFCSAVLDRQEGRDMKLFANGPWKAFGVTHEKVQSVLRQESDSKSQHIFGYMYAEDGKAPNLREHMEYLGFQDSDEDYLWVCQAFKNEPLPRGIRMHIKDTVACWVDEHDPKRTMTLKHPHYDKYKKMLKEAQTRKPVAHWKSIMQFRIEFLLNGIYTWECEMSKNYPPVETVENVLEMGRILDVNIRKEPYKVHVLKRALRHYAGCVREKRKITDVNDFRIMMQRYSDIIEQFEHTRRQEAKLELPTKICVHCSDDAQEPAVLYCNECKDFLCQGCFDWLHSRGRRANHKRTWVRTGWCAECKNELEKSVALFHCVQCSDLYCRDCFAEWHVRGGRRNHIPIILRSYDEKTMGVGSEQSLVAQILDKARSHWFPFYDANGIRTFHNLHPDEAAGGGRWSVSQPVDPECVNEPIGDNIGGGLAGNWAGTWGSNMFPDPLNSVSAMNGAAPL
jgi:hypothetical protein